MDEEQIWRFRVLSSIYMDRKIGKDVIKKYPGVLPLHRIQNYFNLKGVKQKALKSLSAEEKDYIAKVYSKLPVKERKIALGYPSGKISAGTSMEFCELLLTETKLVNANEHYLGTWYPDHLYMLTLKGTWEQIDKTTPMKEIEKRAYKTMRELLDNQSKLNDVRKSALTKFANLVLYTDIKNRYNNNRYMEMAYKFIRPKISDSRWSKMDGKTQYEKLYNWLVCWGDKQNVSYIGYRE